MSHRTVAGIVLLVLAVIVAAVAIWLDRIPALMGRLRRSSLGSPVQARRLVLMVASIVALLAAMFLLNGLAAQDTLDDDLASSILDLLTACFGVWVVFTLYMSYREAAAGRDAPSRWVLGSAAGLLGLMAVGYLVYGLVELYHWAT